MPLTSKISAYDQRWPAMFREEQDRLTPGFADLLVEMHHIGSTAVPDLAAKPEIDILIVVESNDAQTEHFLIGLGYRRGKDLTPGHQFYKRDVKGVRTHKLHVCWAGHPKISHMLMFRDLLRGDPELCRRYQALKLKLERENTDGMASYLAVKEPFIDAAVGWSSLEP